MILKKYRSGFDAVYGAVILITRIICFFICAATIIYLISLRINAAYIIQSLHKVIAYFAPFALFMWYGSRARSRLLKGNLKAPTYAAIFFLAMLAMVMSFAFFSTPMHDIALLFGSHGRWGCAVLKDNGSNIYFINDSTAPLLLFLPVMTLTIIHGAQSYRERKKLSSSF